MAGSKVYLDWLDAMKELHIAKNKGYSPGEDAFGNFRMSEELGIPAWKGALVRLGDKYARVMALANNPDADQVGEAIEDTLSDLAAYSGIVRALYLEAADAAEKAKPCCADPCTECGPAEAYCIQCSESCKCRGIFKPKDASPEYVTCLSFTGVRSVPHKRMASCVDPVPAEGC